jgi:branched-chain amino acid transport system ATP-binding protein
MTGLTIEELSVSYGAARVLRGLTMHVAPAERVALVGANGVGKTTTLRAISGLAARTAPSVRFEGRRVRSNPAAVARMGIAHVPEGRGIFRGLTAVENLRVGAAAVGARLTSARLDWIVDEFPILRDQLNRPAGLLSGGQQQILAVARGLVSNPKLLMVDELSLGLSPKAVSDTIGTLVSVCQQSGTALLLVDQNVHLLAGVCDRMYVLKSGRATEVDPHNVQWSDDWLEVKS